MAAKDGSFRCSFAEKRERLLSYKTYSGFGGSAPSGATEEERQLQNNNNNNNRRCWFFSYGAFSDTVAEGWRTLKDVAGKMWQMGRSDPRKVVFSAKMGLALMLISLLIFMKEPIEELSRYSVWAILTVVVVFEFSIGATLSKGLNRGLGTLSAGGLALGMAVLCEMAGEHEELCLILSIFIVGFLATYAKLYPTMKAYEYGFRVFLITYCFIMVSGYRTREFIHTAVTRFLLIALGAAVCLVVNICLYPIWAGEDLHNLVSKNFMGVATSLEGCVSGYLSCFEYERLPSKILTYQALDDPLYSGYRSAVESTSQEDALVGFAVWEPPHGPYKGLKYPWKDYVKVSGALRHCAFTIMALHGCILSEIQALAERRQVFRSELKRVGTEGAKVLRALGNKMKKMEKLGPVDILYEVQNAAEELQKKVDRKSYLLVRTECWEIGSRPTFDNPQYLMNMDDDDDDDENNHLEFKSKSEAVLDLRSVPSWNGQNYAVRSNSTLPSANVPSENNPFKNQIPWPPGISVVPNMVPREEEKSKTYDNAKALSLATFTSLLIEFVARLQNLVDSFEELSEKANFKEPVEPEAEEVVGFWAWLCGRRHSKLLN